MHEISRVYGVILHKLIKEERHYQSINARFKRGDKYYLNHLLIQTEFIYYFNIKKCHVITIFITIFLYLLQDLNIKNVSTVLKNVEMIPYKQFFLDILSLNSFKLCLTYFWIHKTHQVNSVCPVSQ